MCLGGGAGFILNLPKAKQSIEVFNDINDELINFYLICQRHPDELIRLWELTPRASSIFWGRHQSKLVTDIERAVYFLSQNTFGFCGKDSSFARPRKGKSNTSLAGKIDKLAALSDRLDQVTILNEDVFKVIDFYDSKETFFFLDPPYLTGDQTLYCKHSEFDHEQLSKILRMIQGKYILTIDDSDAARDTYLHTDAAYRLLKQSSSLSRKEGVRRPMNQLAIYKN